MKLVCASLMIILIVLSGCYRRAPQVSPEPQLTSPPESETMPAPTSDNDTSEQPATASQVILKY